MQVKIISGFLNLQFNIREDGDWCLERRMKNYQFNHVLSDFE